MDRRRYIVNRVSALAPPLVIFAQQREVPRVGFLMSETRNRGPSTSRRREMRRRNFLIVLGIIIAAASLAAAGHASTTANTPRPKLPNPLQGRQCRCRDSGSELPCLPPDRLAHGANAARERYRTVAMGCAKDIVEHVGVPRPWRECYKIDERVQFVARLLGGKKMAALCRECV
jgi:hypothetical protein